MIPLTTPTQWMRPESDMPSRLAVWEVLGFCAVPVVRVLRKIPNQPILFDVKTARRQGGKTA